MVDLVAEQWQYDQSRRTSYTTMLNQNARFVFLSRRREKLTLNHFSKLESMMPLGNVLILELTGEGSEQIQAKLWVKEAKSCGYYYLLNWWLGDVDILNLCCCCFWLAKMH